MTHEFTAYTGTSVDAPLVGGLDIVSGKTLDVLWTGSTQAMASQFQDGEIRKLRVTLENPLVIPDEQREAMCGKLSHAAVARQTLAKVQGGELFYDGIIFEDTVDGMEVADVAVIFPRNGSVDHAVKLLGSLTFDDALDDWVASPGFHDQPSTKINSPTPQLDHRIAANGKPANENFNQWFSGSQMVNEDGSPRVFFHGTQSDFDEFRPGNWQAGYFFTADPQYAGERAIDDAENVYANGETIVPVFLRARRLLDTTKGLGAEDEAALVQAGVDPESLDWIRAPDADQWMVFAKDVGGDAFVGACLRAGFDGVVFNEDVASEPKIAYAVFSPTHVKSAIGNSGLYLDDSASLTDHEAALTLTNAVAAKSQIDGVFSCEARLMSKRVKP